LIICPPNLVTKWEEELSAGSKFRQRLERWVKDRATQTARKIEETLSGVVPVRRSRHVQTRKKYNRMRVEAGTYIVSHGLLRKKGVGLSALRREPWDVIIVDEAHHVTARNALVEVEAGCKHKLLLSATPFQLEPREWNQLAHRLVKGRATILGQPEVKTYLESVAARFKNCEEPGPTSAQVRAAQDVFRRVCARTHPAKSSRIYGVLQPNGAVSLINGRVDDLDESGVRKILAAIGANGNQAESLEEFECAYLRFRFDLAHKAEKTYVPMRLGKFLAVGDRNVPSPRLAAIRKWAERTWVEDLEAALADGRPRKTIVFTHWVGDSRSGEAETLRRELAAAFEGAINIVRSRRPKKWKTWQGQGIRWMRNTIKRLRVPDNLGSKISSVVRQCLQGIEKQLSGDELGAVLAGASIRYRRSLRVEIQRQLDAIQAARKDYMSSESKLSFEGRGAKRRLNDALSALGRWGDGGGLRYVERYTGSEDRVARDRASTSFREVAAPWVLVASNVGAEGIDLHTYTRRIVHYDLEWNPARMEQREGRGDRVGRLLKEPLSILYCLVPRTYDERMFHQLVARDRWHGVLLGKAGANLASDEGSQEFRLESTSFIKKVRLNLSPLRRKE
jgi:hypothetical protein